MNRESEGTIPNLRPNTAFLSSMRAASVRRLFSIRLAVIGVLLVATAVRSTVAKETRRKLDITMYGAIADDGRDDTTGIEAAISLSTAGDTLFFPPGMYEISRSLLPASGTILFGPTDGVATVRYTGFTDGDLIHIEDKADVEVGYLVLDGANNTHALNGILASGSERLHIHDVTIRRFVETADFGPHGIYLASGVTNTVISDNVIRDIAPNYQWGGGIRISHGSSGNVVERNTISNTGRGGILANDGSTDLIIRRNTITRTNGEGLGIEIWRNCHRAIVEDNLVDHWLSIDESDYVAVRRNMIRDPDGRTKYIGLEHAGGKYGIFTDNVVESGSEIGISISNTAEKKYNYYAFNTIRKMSRWGAQIQGESSGASHLYFYANNFENTGVGVAVDGQRHGFRVNGDTHFLTLEGNTFIGNQGLGLEISGGNTDTFSITGNTFTENREASVDIDSDVASLRWIGNTVSGNGTDRQVFSRGPINQLPVSAIQSTTVASTAERITFTMEQPSDASPVDAALWDFGDGIPSTERSPGHRYQEPGTYRVSLIVWDAAGQSFRSEQTITVFSLESTEPLGQSYVLPVFEGSTDGSTVELVWEAPLQQGQSRFEVEHFNPGAANFWHTDRIMDTDSVLPEETIYRSVFDHLPPGRHRFRIKLVLADGTSSVSQEVSVMLATPTTFTLWPNFPNPFNRDTEIRFQVPGDGPTRLDVHDMLGRMIATLFDDIARSTQQYSIVFDGENLTSGVYFYTLSFGGRQITHSMLVN